jgi:diguanylate cyclase (GGDEF)-like protein
MPFSADALTGLADRRHLDHVLGEQVALANRDRRPLALALLDLRNFKRVNDTIGYPAADKALRSFANRIRQVARPTDVACRVGGVEFAVVLPHATLEDATQFSERLDKRLVSAPIAALGDTTVTYGIVELEEGEGRDSFLERADRALYEAKKGPPPADALGVREPRRPKPSSGGAPVRKLLDET